jgi:structure-specific recognition protein 1
MASARTFDLKIVQKSGPEHTFTSIAREEHEGIETFLKAKKVRVTNEMTDGDAVMAAPDDSDDDEMQSVASSGEEAPKPRLGDEDEDSEEGELYPFGYCAVPDTLFSPDEDFQASSSDAGSPSDPDSSDSGAVSDASGDAVMRQKKKAPGKEGAANKVSKKQASDDDAPKPKKKAAPKKKPKAEDDSMDVDEERAKTKLKPKKAAANEEGPPKKKVKKE